jgi:hypothetical protein
MALTVHEGPPYGLSDDADADLAQAAVVRIGMPVMLSGGDLVYPFLVYVVPGGALKTGQKEAAKHGEISTSEEAAVAFVCAAPTLFHRPDQRASWGAETGNDLLVRPFPLARATAASERRAPMSLANSVSPCATTWSML